MDIKNTQIIIGTHHADNHISSSFRVTFDSPQHLHDALKRCLTTLLTHGVVSPELIEFDLEMNGVVFEKSVGKERQQRYDKTGN
jgi:hypothetical protein